MPINSRIRKGLFNEVLTSKNWSVNVSSVLGYTRFQQPYNNKKRRFSIASFAGFIENRVRQIAYIACLGIPRH